MLSTFRTLSIFLLMFVLVSSCNDDDAEGEILMQITIPDGSLADSEQLWVFLSDSEGKTLGVRQGKNGTDLIFRRPGGFKEETFTMHFFQQQRVVFSYFSRSLISYASMKPATFTYIPAGEATGSTESVSIFVKDIPEGYTSQLWGKSNTTSSVRSFESGETMLTVTSTIDPADLFVMVYNPETGHAKGALLTAKVLGTTSTMSFNNLEEMGTTTIETPNADNLFVWQVGYRGPVSDGNGVTIHSHSSTLDGGALEAIKLYKAGDSFDFYHSKATIYEGDITYHNSVVSAEPPSVFEKLNVDITSADFSAENFQMSISGTADLAYTYSSRNVAVGNNTMFDSRIVFFPLQSEVNFNYPEIPEEVESSLFPDGYEHYPVQSVMFIDYPDLSSYDEAFEYAQNGPTPALVPREEVGKLFTFNGSSGGRLRAPADITFPFVLRRIE